MRVFVLKNVFLYGAFLVKFLNKVWFKFFNVICVLVVYVNYVMHVMLRGN